MGGTDPGLTVYIYLYDEFGAPRQGTETTKASSQISEEIATHSLTLDTRYPENKTWWILNGKHASSIDSNYLSFNTGSGVQDSFPRNRVSLVQDYNSGGFLGCRGCTQFVLENGFHDNAYPLIQGTFYTSPYPTGYFSKNITLYGGLNQLMIEVEDGNGRYDQELRYVELDLSGPAISPMVKNHNDQRIDNLQPDTDGEAGYAVNFEITASHTSGISQATVQVKCTSGSCGSYDKEFALNLDSGSYKNSTILYSVGTYSANYTIDSNDGKRSTQILTFDVEDTTPPQLTIYAPNPLAVERSYADIVYQDYINVIGVTEPSATINIFVQNDSLDIIATNSTTVPSDITTHLNTHDVIVDLSRLIHKPMQGDEVIYLDGHLGTSLKNNYIEIEIDGISHNPLTERYQVLTVSNTTIPILGNKEVTMIKITPALREDIELTGIVDVYDRSKETGYFEKLVHLLPGMNKLIIRSTDSSQRLTDNVPLYVEYDNNTFDITIVNPTGGVVGYTDFSNQGNTIPIQVRTEMNDAGFQTTCYISHDTSDIVAKAFTDVEMTTSNNIDHTFTLNSNSCVENGGNYCMIGGNSTVPINYHHYTINCTPTAATMASKETSLCFTVATYGLVTGGSPRGENICAASTGCGFANDQCQSSTSCGDYLNSASCLNSQVCKWTSGFGCGDDCYSGYEDPDDDDICTAPVVTCSDYNNNKQNCMSQAMCKWCSSNNNCLTSSCSSCNGLEHDSDIDNECDDGSSGQHGLG